MTVEQRNLQAFDPAASLSIGISSLVLIAVAGVLCQVAKITGPLGEVLFGLASAIPATTALLVRRIRSSPMSRAASIAQNNLSTNPIIVVLLLGSFLVLLDSAIGGLVGAIAGATAATAKQFGATDAMMQKMQGEGFGIGSIIAAPILIAGAILAGRRARHYIAARLLLCLLAAGALYYIIRMIIIFLAKGSLGSLGIGASIQAFALLYAILALGFVLFLWLGSLWGRRSNDSFVGGRLLAQLPRDQRQAALDLLRESVRY